MSLQEQFHTLVAGRKPGIPATLLRSGLRLLEVPYSTAVSLRNALYDQSLLPVRRFSVPMISVGNLTLGGTGKSPIAVWLCQFFLEQNKQPGLVSRGYGKETSKDKTSKGNDEFLEMSHCFPNVPHVQHPNRSIAIQTLLAANHADLIILDDAFQHRQVHRNIDLVLLDATAPFGFEHIFPRGTLRESLKSLRRADIVLLTRSDLVDEADRQAIRQRVLSVNPKIIWGETIHVPTSLISLEKLPRMGCLPDLKIGIESVRGQSALAFCGIGNPVAFRKTLEQCGVRVKKFITFPDHYHYTADDAKKLIQTAKELSADSILCTMKDLVKLNMPEFLGQPPRAVAIEIQFTTGKSAVCDRLTHL